MFKFYLGILCTFFCLIAGFQQVNALPQYSVESARTCINCHVKPTGWTDPKVSMRKCTLDCTACHVNPTGSGMRTAAGTFYGRQILPMFGNKPTTVEAETSRRAEKPNPMIGDGTVAPAPLSPDRYAGLQPFPFFQVGFDLRTMAYFPEAENEDDAFFPMQADLYLALRPYNPDEYNNGRLTLLVNTGFEGDREKEYKDILDRWFVREWWALYSDLPNQMYVKAGRFLPAYGWRLDDHTAFIREPQTFNHDRQVTGLEFGMNPNYPYVTMSIFNSAKEWDKPWEPDDGYGAAITGGYRHFLWQLGGSAMFESNDDIDQYWAGLQWGLNLMNANHPWKTFNWLPMIYLGEVNLWNRSLASDDEDILGLTAFHQCTFFLFSGVSMVLRYEWQDNNVEVKDDHRHRYVVGVDYAPYKHVSFLAQYRFNDEPQGIDDDEMMLQMHLWY